MTGKKRTQKRKSLSPAEKAASCFRNGFSCSQSVLCAYAPRFGINRTQSLKVACAFGGGMARRGDTCGAVTGALMVVGLNHGKAKKGDDAAREKTYDLAKKFITEFSARNGAIVCRELLGYDISIPVEMEAAKREQLFETLCPRLVQDAVEILEQQLGARKPVKKV